MRRYCMALDLKEDPALIEEYEFWHKSENRRPEIMKSISDAGISNMEIYRTGNRLFMIMEVDDNFSFDRKAKMDAEDPKVQEWEAFVWKFQKPLAWSKPGEKWIMMDKIF